MINVLKVYAGDTEPIVLTFTDVDGNVLDISSAFVYTNPSQYDNVDFTVRDRSGNEIMHKSLYLPATGVANGISFVTDGTDGKLQIELEEGDTYSLKGTYDYDIQIIKDGKVQTYKKSKFIVIEQVTEVFYG